MKLNKTVKYMYLKTVDTFGNCQRPVFSIGVSQHMHKITDLWKFELIWSLKLQDNNERKNTLVTRSDFTCLISRLQILNLRSWNQIRWKLPYFRGSRFSQCFILSNQPPPITRYQVRFSDNNYFEKLPIVSTAFKGLYIPFL